MMTCGCSVSSSSLSLTFSPVMNTKGPKLQLTELGFSHRNKNI